MAVIDVLNYSICQLILFLILIHETHPYEKLLLEDGRLCKLKPDDRRASISLGTEKDSSVIVTQKTYFAKWTGRYDFKCSFSVTAPKNYGIYAVIQVLNFRKNETTGACKDYVLFDVPRNALKSFLQKGVKHRSFCGRIYAAQTYLSNPNQSAHRASVSPVAANGFVAVEGHMHVLIYVAQQRLLKHEKLEVKIAFTAYKNECNNMRPKSAQCKSCEWIWQDLVGDHVQNCPYTSCWDENQCKDLENPFGVEDVNVISKETGTKVTVVAISAIMITFFTFSICLCICRRSQKCCWQPPNNSVRVEMNGPRPNAGEEFVTTFQEIPSDAVSPSAPVETDIKDAPPSYESLFPSK